MDPIFGFLTAGLLFAIGLYMILASRVVKQLPGAILRRKKDAATILGLALIGFALMNGAWLEVSGWAGGASATVAGITTTNPTGAAISCPDDGETSVKLEIMNPANTATYEEYDASVTCVSPVDSVSITDTTDPAASAFTCGQTYTCYVTSTSGAAGDSSQVHNIVTGSGTINAQGNLVFTASGALQNLVLGIPQHGVPEVRVWDVTNAAWVYANASSTASDWSSTDGQTYYTTTSNSTALAVGTAGEVNRKIYFRSTVTDQVLNEGSARGMVILVDAGTAVWDTPTVKLDGEVLVSNCEGLDAEERIAKSSYEYCYIYSGSKDFSNGKQGVIDFNVFALAGVDPGASDDIQIDLGFVGQKAKTLNPLEYRQSLVDDTSSRADIHTVHDLNFDFS